MTSPATAKKLRAAKEDLRRVTAELAVLKVLVLRVVRHEPFCQKDEVEGLACRCGLDEEIAKLGDLR